MAKYRIATLDVFTTQRFRGNQLGLVHIPKDQPLTQEQKQEIAREFGYSESVFLHEDDGSGQGRRVDIFTTDQELPFAGHPTIGSLCYIAQEELGGKDGTIQIQLKAGPVAATYRAASRAAEAAVPHNVCIHQHKIPREELLGIQSNLQKDDLQTLTDVVSIVNGMTFAMIELPSLERLGVLQLPRTGPNFKFDAGWDGTFVGQMYFVDLGHDNDGVRKLRTRMMDLGMGEDAATGSASCCLGVYLALRDGKADGVYQFALVQGVEMGRKSEISIRVSLDATGKGVKSVDLGGSAVVVMRGEIDLA